MSNISAVLSKIFSQNGQGKVRKFLSVIWASTLLAQSANGSIKKEIVHRIHTRKYAAFILNNNLNLCHGKLSILTNARKEPDKYYVTFKWPWNAIAGDYTGLYYEASISCITCKFYGWTIKVKFKKSHTLWTGIFSR